MPIDAISGALAAPAQAGASPVGGAEWRIEAPELGVGEGGRVESEGGGFGDLLSGQLSKLQGLQDEAAGAGQALAAGTATDVSSVVMAIERAQLAMQLASQVRTKAVESYQEIFRTQV